ncbi:acyltransferase domain-containing protein [Micromonospora sp. BRA006-A]|nr:acyltransferase domain-containing protein [Micromonospora sp. BRA006-A]
MAAVNGPASVVVSGAFGGVAVVVAACRERGWRVKELAVSHAFHSRLMEPMLEEFRSVVAGLDWRAPRIPIVSNVTGAVADAAEITEPGYWVRHVRQPVRFADAVRTLHQQDVTQFLEVGPDAVLTAMAQDCVEATGEVRFTATMRAGHSEADTLRTALAERYVTGDHVDWTGYLAALDGSGPERAAEARPAPSPCPRTPSTSSATGSTPARGSRRRPGSVSAPSTTRCSAPPYASPTTTYGSSAPNSPY